MCMMHLLIMLLDVLIRFDWKMQGLVEDSACVITEKRRGIFQNMLSKGTFLINNNQMWVEQQS